MQGAIGCEQLNKLQKFVDKRINNWNKLFAGLSDLSEYLVLPKATNNSLPSWFGFLITVKKGIKRDELVRYLEEHGIQTRMLFAGNLLKHPCFEDKKIRNAYRVVGLLENTEIILNNTFWIGVYPGLTDDMLEYIINTIHAFFQERNKMKRDDQ